MNDHEYSDAQKFFFDEARKALEEATTDAQRLAIYRTFGDSVIQAYRDWDGGDPSEPAIE